MKRKIGRIEKKKLSRIPIYRKKVMWGLVPHIQALLLARHIRGDIEQYPSFVWK
jgi:CRISPR-associated protein Cas1